MCESRMRMLHVMPCYGNCILQGFFKGFPLASSTGCDTFPCHFLLHNSQLASCFWSILSTAPSTLSSPEKQISPAKQQVVWVNVLHSLLHIISRMLLLARSPLFSFVLHFLFSLFYAFQRDVSKEECWWLMDLCPVLIWLFSRTQVVLSMAESDCYFTGEFTWLTPAKSFVQLMLGGQCSVHPAQSTVEWYIWTSSLICLWWSASIDLHVPPMRDVEMIEDVNAAHSNWSFCSWQTHAFHHVGINQQQEMPLLFLFNISPIVGLRPHWIVNDKRWLIQICTVGCKPMSKLIDSNCQLLANWC